MKKGEVASEKDSWGSLRGRSRAPNQPMVSNRSRCQNVTFGCERLLSMTIGASEKQPRRPLVLGIETSCDDTACAVLDGEGTVLSSVISSQLEPHRPYGGVGPEIASREHLHNWPAVSSEALRTSGLELSDLDVFSSTRGPGLMGSLLVGLSLGKAMAYALERPFHAVHHIEGHLFSPFLAAPGEPADPLPEHFTGLVVSGGHTLLIAARERGRRLETLARTRDDAMGEVFDKIGKRIGLPFPGGERLDELAERGRAEAHPMPIARCGDSLDFSTQRMLPASAVSSWQRGSVVRLESRGCICLDRR